MGEFKQCCEGMMITIVCLLGCIVLMMAIKMLRKFCNSPNSGERPDETLRRAVQDSERQIGWYGDNRYSMVSKGITPSRKILDASKHQSTQSNEVDVSEKCQHSTKAFSGIRTQSDKFGDCCNTPDLDGQITSVPRVLTGKTTSNESKKTDVTFVPSCKSQYEDDLALTDLGSAPGNTDLCDKPSGISTEYPYSSVTPPWDRQEKKVLFPSSSNSQHQAVLTTNELTSAPENQDQCDKPAQISTEYPYATAWKGQARKVNSSGKSQHQDSLTPDELRSAQGNQVRLQDPARKSECDYAAPWDDRQAYVIQSDFDLAKSGPNNKVFPASVSQSIPKGDNHRGLLTTNF